MIFTVDPMKVDIFWYFTTKNFYFKSTIKIFISKIILWLGNNYFSVIEMNEGFACFSTALAYYFKFSPVYKGTTKQTALIPFFEALTTNKFNKKQLKTNTYSVMLEQCQKYFKLRKKMFSFYLKVSDVIFNFIYDSLLNEIVDL